MAPTGLHLPQFTYTEPKIAPNAGVTGNNDPPAQYEESLSQGFPFSAYFQSSSSVSPGLSVIRVPVEHGNASKSVLRSSLSPATLDSTSSASSSFIGFSWGPPSDAFPPAMPDPEHGVENSNTRPTLIPVPIHGTPAMGLYPNPLVPTPGPADGGNILSTPRPFSYNPPYNYSTPRRPYALSPYHTLQRTSTIRRSNAPRRSVSDREAMKQLVDCVGMSARKKVLESGRKPRVIGVWSLGGGKSGGGGVRGEGTGGKGSYRKELRFDPLATPIPRPDYGILNPSSEMGTVTTTSTTTTTRSHRNNSGYSSNNDDQRNYRAGYIHASSEEEDSNTDSEEGIGGPPSPSPSPRPGSVTSMSKRSGTPTATTTMTMMMMSGSMNNLSGNGMISYRNSSGTGMTTTTTTTTTGYLSIPSAGALNLDFQLGVPPENGNGNRRRSIAAGAAGGVFVGVGQPTTTTRLGSSKVESRKQSQSTSFRQRRGGGGGNLVDDEDEVGRDGYGSSECMTRSEWDKFEKRYWVMMQDIEDLEERVQGLNASING